jgi:DNA-binding transcriptional regulator YiaG
MSKEARFYVDGRELQAEPFHYKLCGLDDIYLLNGFTIEESEYGRGVAIHDARELHKAIGEHLILHRKALSRREIRFLRKEIGLTQDELGKALKVTGQTIARYEKGETLIPGPAEQLLRVFYAFHLLPDEAQAEFLKELLTQQEDQNDEGSGPIYFGTNLRGEWDEANLVSA